MLHLRNSSKKLSFISRHFISTTQRFSSSTSKSTENVEKIEIPNYIKRSPTDILKALSGTVGFDPTAPHYKYHDDPFLIPTSNAQKRMYALAQESGRKSAKFIREKHADLFQVSLIHFILNITS
jgi:pentatricopeptide repeat domain-containing protein 3